MVLTRVIDEHPGKWQDGIALFLCKVTQLSDSGIGRKGECFITGFAHGINTPMGMFGLNSQPVQIIEKRDDKYYFTMCNATTISTEDVDRIVKDKCVTLGDTADVYPVYKIEIL